SKSPIDKYKPALKTLIPFRPFANKKNEHPNDKAGLVSTMTFSWFTVLVLRAFRKPPSTEDLWQLSKYDRTEPNYARMLRFWKNEVSSKGIKNASLWRVFIRFIRTRMILTLILTCLFSGVVFISSGIILRKLIQHVSNPEYSLSHGLVLVGALIAAEVTRASLLTAVYVINYRTAVRCRSAMLMMIFHKVLHLTHVPGSISAGELTNMCSNDGDRIFEICRTGNLVVMGPILFITGTVYVCVLIGPIGLIGSGIFILMLPVQGILVKLMNSIRQKAVALTDQRVHKINEILTSIKLIKMYSWEKPFSDVVHAIRVKELSLLKIAAFLGSVNISAAFLTPVVAAVIMFSAYVSFGHNLTAEEAFTCVALFNVMSYGLKLMPISIKSIADGAASFKRLQEVLCIKDEQDYVRKKTRDKQNIIKVENASLSWNSKTSTVDETDSKVVEDTPVTLQSIDLTVQNGDLIGIYGPVGSGKSSLFSALLGQMELLGGSVAVCESIAYAAQEAWLMNATVRENIIFGSTYNKILYKKVIYACGLEQDFNILPSRDLTEVGERGLNLSGGQKQRISLARALYSDRDLYLLDDPLSAVDAHVGKHIFFEAIFTFLKSRGKTILFVTHQTQYLLHCDKVFLMKNGTLIRTLEHEFDENELTKSEDKAEVVGDTTSASIQSPGSPGKSLNENDLEIQGKLMSDEERGSAIPMSTYYSYIKASGGFILWMLMSMFFFINVGAQQFGNFWISFWINQGSGRENFSAPVMFDLTVSNSLLDNPNFGLYLIIYGVVALAMAVISVLRGFSYVSMTIQGSGVLHSQLFKKTLYATMTFYDVTPSGRILNRFQKDMDELDTVLPFLWEMFILNFTTLLIAAALIAYVFPQFLIIMAIVLPMIFFVYIFFRPAARELKRLDVLSRSPLLSHITATVNGLDSIKAYCQLTEFAAEFQRLLDINGVPCYLFACANRWLALRLDMLTVITGVVTTVLVIVYGDVVSPASAGLALSSSFLMTGLIQFTIRLLTEAEARFVTFDRIKYYITNIPQEESKSTITPEESWPARGVVEYSNVSMRYRPGLQLALKNISFKINEKEKIGIVGRTGSGKSSLAVTLFRLVDSSSGSIIIDGVDIKSVDLHDLRSKLSIIPQDPVLFSGSVRYNLDPFSKHSDDALWIALEKTHLKPLISSQEGQLESTVLEGGSNFSVGERQLICLARALLRNSKILVLDEATAAVDSDTEKLVHEMTKEMFADCTIITIAHRLTSVTSCDRVIVMNDGEIVEFDEPNVLLSNEHSQF
uniref:Uncharacterized protein n=1 Tax=Ciona savignyi TaxID=51511 RepID=H2ZGG5_CIOSA